MKIGIEESAVYCLFISQDVFKNGSTVLTEFRYAHKCQKKMIIFHHPDTGQTNYLSFEDYKKDCPPDLKYLFTILESIPLRTRMFEVDAVADRVEARYDQLMSPKK